MLNVYKLRRSLKEIENENASTYFKVTKVIGYLIAIALTALVVYLVIGEPEEYEVLYFMPLLAALYTIFSVYPKMPISIFVLKLNENNITIMKYQLYVCLEVMAVYALSVLLTAVLFDFNWGSALAIGVTTFLLTFAFSAYMLLVSRVPFLELTQKLNRYSILFAPIYLNLFLMYVGAFFISDVVAIIFGAILLGYFVFLLFVPVTVALYGVNKYRRIK